MDEYRELPTYQIDRVRIIGTAIVRKLFKEEPMRLIPRGKGESIVVRNDVTVTVVEIARGKVRMAITAPNALPVELQEIHDSISGPAER